MLPADGAEVNWDFHRKQWIVRLKVGEEVMLRPISKTPQSASDDVLRSLAVETAHADGYEVNPGKIVIVH